MSAKKNPLGLNKLQLKTLTILQELAADPDMGVRDEDGSVRLSQLPHPHGNHFHVGRAVVAAADATGLQNEAVWVALQRKGLVRSMFPVAIVVTPEGLAYDTGMRHEILHGSDH